MLVSCAHRRSEKPVKIKVDSEKSQVAIRAIHKTSYILCICTQLSCIYFRSESWTCTLVCNVFFCQTVTRPISQADGVSPGGRWRLPHPTGHPVQGLGLGNGGRVSLCSGRDPGGLPVGDPTPHWLSFPRVAWEKGSKCSVPWELTQALQSAGTDLKSHL